MADALYPVDHGSDDDDNDDDGVSPNGIGERSLSPMLCVMCLFFWSLPPRKPSHAALSSGASLLPSLPAGQAMPGQPSVNLFLSILHSPQGGRSFGCCGTCDDDDDDDDN